ncbi:Rz1-like lysis system protein LysC [Thalassolituus oleivorans]|uniref:Rz1-like lysis system protein LysC n=1 Tax=Thalassolituus oleivorans TaxID=187493 RepID=UPI003C6FEA99
MLNLKHGLLVLCLTILASCSAQKTLPDIPPSPSSCPIVSACTLSPVLLKNHLDIVNALLTTENDWADCAAQIDAIVECQLRDQVRTNEQTE